MLVDGFGEAFVSNLLLKNLTVPTSSTAPTIASTSNPVTASNEQAANPEVSAEVS
jgi:hypothetical protein